MQSNAAVMQEPRASMPESLYRKHTSPSDVILKVLIYAAAVITGLREGGARVPEDISIVGFDDVDIARMTFPPLTTIHQDGIGKGRWA